MGAYIILSMGISNEKAYLLQSLCSRLKIDYYSEYTDSNRKEQYTAAGPVTEGDKNQVCQCLAGENYVVLEATKIETV